MRRARLAAIQMGFSQAAHAEGAWERMLGLAVAARQDGAQLLLFPALAALEPLQAMAGRGWRLGSELAEVLWIWAGPLEEMYMRWGRDIARSLGVYVCPGTVPVLREQQLKHMACLFAPTGAALAACYQCHMDSWEADLGLVGHDEVALADTDLGRVGFLLGGDSRVPEMGRILTLMGADVLLAPSAHSGPHRYWHQLSATWSQVQATQVYAVEAHLVGDCGGQQLAGRSSIHGPCETTSGGSGILAQARQDSRDALVSADVDLLALKGVRSDFNVRAGLNPEFYGRHMPGIYQREGKRR